MDFTESHYMELSPEHFTLTPALKWRVLVRTVFVSVIFQLTLVLVELKLGGLIRQWPLLSSSTTLYITGVALFLGFMGNMIANYAHKYPSISVYPKNAGLLAVMVGLTGITVLFLEETVHPVVWRPGVALVAASSIALFEARMVDDNNPPSLILQSGKLFRGLAYQAQLGLMIFRFWALTSSLTSSGSPSAANKVSVRVDVIEVVLAIGFWFNFTGILLYSKCGTFSFYSCYVGLVGVVLGFYGIMFMFLPLEVAKWAAGAAAVQLFVTLTIALFKYKK